MIVIKIFEAILVTVYGGLNIYSAWMGAQGNVTNFWANLMMIFGGTLIIFATYLQLFFGENKIIFFLIGIFMIHIAAINYDIKMYKTIDKRHQILRFMISLILITLFYKSF